MIPPKTNKNIIESRNEKAVNVGFIPILDFLTQHGINNNSIVKDLEIVSESQTDIVSEFLNDDEINIFFKQGNIPSIETLAKYNLTAQSLTKEWDKIKNSNKPKNILDRKKILEAFSQTLFTFDTLGNKQHTGNAVASTSKEILQNAIDTTVKLLDPTIPPIGKFGMGAKTTLGMLTGKGQYILYNSSLNGESKQLFIFQTGSTIEDIVISENSDFIHAQNPNIKPRTRKGTTVEINLSAEPNSSFATDCNSAVIEAINAFRYNPNISLKASVNGNKIKEYDQSKATTGIITVDARDGKIIISDEGEGFDPINVFSDSTKNSSQRNLIEFKDDSKFIIDKDSDHPVTMLLQDTVVTYEDFDPKKMQEYNVESFAMGLVIDNKTYIGTAETRNNWLVTEQTIPNFKHAITELLNSSTVIKEKAKYINTIYMWLSSMHRSKQEKLSKVKELLFNAVNEIANDKSILLLPNTQEYTQFRSNDKSIVFLDRDLIRSYDPSTLEGTSFVNSSNGYAVWSVPMNHNLKNLETELANRDVTRLADIRTGIKLEHLGLLRVLKIENNQIPQIWIDSPIVDHLNILEINIDSEAEEEAKYQLIEDYNLIIWILNAQLNKIDDSYKAIEAPTQYLPTYKFKQKEAEKSAKLRAKIEQDQATKSMLEDLNIHSNQTVLEIKRHLESGAGGKSESILEFLDQDDIENLSSQVSVSNTMMSTAIRTAYCNIMIFNQGSVFHITYNIGGALKLIEFKANELNKFPEIISMFNNIKQGYRLMDPLKVITAMRNIVEGKSETSTQDELKVLFSQIIPDDSSIESPIKNIANNKNNESSLFINNSLTLNKNNLTLKKEVVKVFQPKTYNDYEDYDDNEEDSDNDDYSGYLANSYADDGSDDNDYEDYDSFMATYDESQSLNVDTPIDNPGDVQFDEDTTKLSEFVIKLSSDPHISLFINNETLTSLEDLNTTNKNDIVHKWLESIVKLNGKWDDFIDFYSQGGEVNKGVSSETNKGTNKEVKLSELTENFTDEQVNENINSIYFENPKANLYELNHPFFNLSFQTSFDDYDQDIRITLNYKGVWVYDHLDPTMDIYRTISDILLQSSDQTYLDIKYIDEIIEKLNYFKEDYDTNSINSSDESSVIRGILNSVEQKNDQDLDSDSGSLQKWNIVRLESDYFNDNVKFDFLNRFDVFVCGSHCIIDKQWINYDEETRTLVKYFIKAAKDPNFYFSELLSDDYNTNYNTNEVDEDYFKILRKSIEFSLKANGKWDDFISNEDEELANANRMEIPNIYEEYNENQIEASRNSVFYGQNENGEYTVDHPYFSFVIEYNGSINNNFYDIALTFGRETLHLTINDDDELLYSVYTMIAENNFSSFLPFENSEDIKELLLDNKIPARNDQIDREGKIILFSKIINNIKPQIKNIDDDIYNNGEDFTLEPWFSNAIEYNQEREEFNNIIFDSLNCILTSQGLRRGQNSIDLDEEAKELLKYFYEAAKDPIFVFCDLDYSKYALKEDAIVDKFKKILEFNLKINDKWGKVNNPEIFTIKDIPESKKVEADPKKFRKILEDLSSIETDLSEFTGPNYQSIDDKLSKIARKGVDGIPNLKLDIDLIKSSLEGFYPENPASSYNTELNNLNENIYRKSYQGLAKIGSEERKFDNAIENVRLIAEIIRNLDQSISPEVKGKYVMALMMYQGDDIDKYSFDKFSRINKTLESLIPLTTNPIHISLLETSTLLGAKTFKDELKLEQYITILENLARFGSDKPELYRELSKTIFDRTTESTAKESVTVGHSKELSMFERMLYGLEPRARHIHYLRFLSTQGAQLLEQNIIENFDQNPIMDIELKPNTTIGDVAYAGVLNQGKPWTKAMFKDLADSDYMKRAVDKINIKHTTLAQSQAAISELVTVVQELLQNSKDISYSTDHKVVIKLIQDLFTYKSGDTSPTEGLKSDKVYRRTRFEDNGTGVPDLLMNYFNPDRTTKKDADTAGGFGCGAITINGACDIYEINSKEKDQDAQRIVVEVIRENNKVIGTKVLSISTTDRQDIGFSIDMYKEVKEGDIPEIDSLIINSALTELSRLEIANNDNLSIVMQGEELISDKNIESVYKNDEIQIVKNIGLGYYVKGLKISEYNSNKDRSANALPAFINTLLTVNDEVTINFLNPAGSQNEIEVVRTRNGFTAKGENQAMITLYKNYMQCLAKRIFEGDPIDIPGLDNNMAYAYSLYSDRKKDLALDLYNGNVTDSKQFLGFNNDDWIGLLFNTPFENKDGNTNTIVQYFETLEIIKAEAKNKAMSTQKELDKITKDAQDSMSSEQLQRYNDLKKSGLKNTYYSATSDSILNQSTTPSQRRNSETVILDLDIPKMLKTKDQERNIKLFEKIFKLVTDNLPDTSGNKTKFKLIWVSRTIGNDYAGSKNGEYFECKYNINNIKDLNLNSMSDANMDKIYSVIIHEIAHHIDFLSGRNSDHDAIFSEMMKLNFARLSATIA